MTQRKELIALSVLLLVVSSCVAAPVRHPQFRSLRSAADSSTVADSKAVALSAAGEGSGSGSSTSCRNFSAFGCHVCVGKGAGKHWSWSTFSKSETHPCLWDSSDNTCKRRKVSRTDAKFKTTIAQCVALSTSNAVCQDSLNLEHYGRVRDDPKDASCHWDVNPSGHATIFRNNLGSHASLPVPGKKTRDVGGFLNDNPVYILKAGTTLITGSPVTHGVTEETFLPTVLDRKPWKFFSIYKPHDFAYGRGKIALYYELRRDLPVLWLGVKKKYGHGNAIVKDYFKPARINAYASCHECEVVIHGSIISQHLLEYKGYALPGAPLQVGPKIKSMPGTFVAADPPDNVGLQDGVIQSADF